MIPIIITIISGLVMSGLFLKLKRILKKRKLPYSLSWLPSGIVFCMIMFVLSTCVIVTGILENFYSEWTAGSVSLGVTIVLMIVLFKLFDRELDRLKDLKKEKRGD